MSHQYSFSPQKSELLSYHSLAWTVHIGVMHYSIHIKYNFTCALMHVPEVPYSRKPTLQFNIMKPTFHIIFSTNSYLLLVLKVVLFLKSSWLYSPFIQPTLATSASCMRPPSFQITRMICIQIVCVWSIASYIPVSAFPPFCDNLPSSYVLDSPGSFLEHQFSYFAPFFHWEEPCCIKDVSTIPRLGLIKLFFFNMLHI